MRVRLLSALLLLMVAGVGCDDVVSPQAPLSGGTGMPSAPQTSP